MGKTQELEIKEELVVGKIMVAKNPLHLGNYCF